MGRSKSSVLDDLLVPPRWRIPLAAGIACSPIGGAPPSPVPRQKPACVAFHTVLPRIAPIVTTVLVRCCCLDAATPPERPAKQ